MLNIFKKRKEGPPPVEALSLGRKPNQALPLPPRPGGHTYHRGLVDREDTLCSLDDSASDVVYSRLHEQQTTLGDGRYSHVKQSGEICYSSALGAGSEVEYSAVKDGYDTDSVIYTSLRSPTDTKGKRTSDGDDDPLYDRAEHKEPIYARVVKE